MSDTFDLDAARAARREAGGKAVSFTFGGERFDLPVEMPLEALDVIASLPENLDAITPQEGAAMMVPVMKAMLGPDEWQRFVRHRPTVEDVTTLAEHLWSAYGVDPQPPSRSERRARATGVASKRTSRPRTASTRVPSATATSA